MGYPAISERPPRAADAMRSLVEASDGLSEAFCALSQRTLRTVLGDADLLRHLQPGALEKFTRQLIFSDPVNRFGIWMLTWPPGFGTSIHSHHCSCAFGVYQGQLDEVVYEVDADGDGDTAVESARFVRGPGHVGGAPRERRMVHQMVNSGTQAAVSVHIYAYQPDRHDDSIERSFVRSPL